MISHFYPSMTSGSIHVGDIGELVATILLLFTMDKVFGPENHGDSHKALGKRNSYDLLSLSPKK